MQALIDLLRDNWAWVAGLVVATAALVKLLLSKQFALKAEVGAALKSLSDKVEGIDGRIDALERWEAVTTERLEHIPTIDDFRRLENSVGTLTAGVEKLNAKSEAAQLTLGTVQESLQHITNHLMSGHGGKSK